MTEELSSGYSSQPEGLEKGPAVNNERAPHSYPGSLQDNVDESHEVADTVQKDIETDIGAWSCVLASLLFLIPSFGKFHCTIKATFHSRK